jgi:Cys-tRNA synthase (O-phospho-L-seryl-tRNA:Cys-tRNA synthase)
MPGTIQYKILFMLSFGRNPDTPVIASLRSRNPTVNEFVGRWSEQLSKARDCIQVAQQQQKQYAGRHHRAAPIYFNSPVMRCC